MTSSLVTDWRTAEYRAAVVQSRQDQTAGQCLCQISLVLASSDNVVLATEVKHLPVRADQLTKYGLVSGDSNYCQESKVRKYALRALVLLRYSMTARDVTLLVPNAHPSFLCDIASLTP